MKTNAQIARFVWMTVALVIAGSFHAAWAQATNGTVGTNTPPVPGSNPFPVGKDAAWFAIIPLATFAVTWLVGKIETLPKQFLPLITPIIGWLVGFGVEKATNANFPWWSTAGAGAISTMIYESLKGITGAGPASALTPTPQRAKVIDTR